MTVAPVPLLSAAALLCRVPFWPAPQEKGCIVITTPFDTYAAARLISTAAPVRHFMRSKNLLEFSVNTAVEDARKVMANVRHRYFPILDANGKYCGVISRRNLLNVHRKQVIMVDHNERGQAVDRSGAGGDSGDHRPSPSWCTGNCRAGVFPQRAGWLHRYYHQPHV